MSMDEMKQQEKAEQRRKRRKKQQLQAFAILGASLVVVLAIILGAYFSINAVVKNTKKNTTKKDDKKAEQTVADVEPEDNADADVEPSGEDENGETTDDTLSAAEQVANKASDEPEKTDEEIAQENYEKYVDSIIESMTIEEKVAGMFFVSPQNITGVANAKVAGNSTSSAMSKYAVGGVIYDKTNIEDKGQLNTLIYNTRTFSKYPIFIGIEDQGGENSVFSTTGIRETPLPSQSQISVEGGTTEAYSLGINVSSTMKSLSIDVNFAPLADVTIKDNSIIAADSFGTSVSNVASLSKSVVKGMVDQGVNGCAKYFPGMGDITTDPKNGVIKSDRTKADLEGMEYEVFRGLIEQGVSMIMVSHVTMPNVIGDSTPASLSSVVVTDMLRNELGFDGIIVTDYMNKSAITKKYRHADAAVLAIQAGVDMILVPGDFKKSYEGVLAAVSAGTITEERINESMKRICMIKYSDSIIPNEINP